MSGLVPPLGHLSTRACPAAAVATVAATLALLLPSAPSPGLEREARAATTRHAAASAPASHRWTNGPPDDPSYFPIGVWLQTPSRAAEYKDIGINLYIGQWQGPTEAQLAALAAAGMPVMATQNDTGLDHVDDPIIVGWTQTDEPDNAQPDGQGGYGPCVDPDVIIARYEQMKRRDPTRPVLLNLGQGVAHDYDRPYVGRGSACASRWDQYPAYVQGADIVSFDIYPVTSPYDHIRDQLWRVALGVDRLREWSKGEKTIWNVIETTHIHSTAMPTPHQIRAEVWMSLIHGSEGIVYFAHEWQPRFREAGLLHYPESREAVAAVNARIHALAPVLNSPTVHDGATVASSNAATPVDVMVKHHDGWTYLFAAAMRDSPTDATFTLPTAASGPVEVIGEGREIALRGTTFRDAFAGYDVHLYRARTGRQLELPWLARP